MTMSDFIFNMIQTIGLLTPMIVMSYNFGKYRGRTDQILVEHTKDINGIGTKVSEIRDTQMQTLNELKTQIDNLAITLARVTQSIQYIEKHIDELREK